jgi:DNA adenine methylase
MVVSKKKKKKVAVALRYPGGKTRATTRISELFPHHSDFFEYREPFIGGGSVFLKVLSMFPDKRFWISDLNDDLSQFWLEVRDKPSRLISKIKAYKDIYDGRGPELYDVMKRSWDYNSIKSPQHRAVRFFILNRITFSGTVESGGYSQQAFDKRFTDSSIERIKKLSQALSGLDLKITNDDFMVPVQTASFRTFMYLDPPYYGNQKSKLYGTNGDLHVGFNHKKLYYFLEKSSARWLLSYDDCPEIREMYRNYYIEPFDLQYGMNNYKQDTAKKGGELLIRNYK